MSPRAASISANEAVCAASGSSAPERARAV
jgi:hypothetical protein